MALSWQEPPQKPRRVGMRRTEKLAFGHQLETLPGSALPLASSSEDVRVEEDLRIFAPPESASSRTSSSRLSSLSAEPEAPSSPKRKREPSSSQHVDLTEPSPIKKLRGSKDALLFQPSNIPITQFVSSDHSDQSRKGGGNMRYSSQGSRYDRSNASVEPYPFSSQPKVKHSYSGRQSSVNIHKNAPVKKQQKKAKREPEPAEALIRIGESGFKKFDSGAMYSLVKTPERKRSAKAFNAPKVVLPSPRSKRAALRSGNTTKEDQKPAQLEFFKKPRRPPSPQIKNSSSPSSSVPQALPHDVEDRRPSGSASASPNIPSLDATNLENIAAKLNIPVEIPTSSAALSSGPFFDFDLGDSSSSSSLSSAPEVEELDSDQFHQKWLESHPPTSPKEICPICKGPVSKLFKDGFLGPAVSSVRQQHNFCTAHRIRSAEETWRAKGYPEIDWKRFPQRLPNYDAALSSILNGTDRSFYRNALEDDIKRGVNRTLKQALMSERDSEGLRRGYYGTKGARMMMDYIMSRFASRIRRLGGTDKLISAAGVSGFVQAVLVPELVVMLVKDDMQVDEEQARVILEDSTEIGHLLNEEEDEAIKDAEEEEAMEETIDKEMVEILELD